MFDSEAVGVIVMMHLTLFFRFHRVVHGLLVIPKPSMVETATAKKSAVAKNMIRIITVVCG